MPGRRVEPFVIRSDQSDQWLANACSLFISMSNRPTDLGSFPTAMRRELGGRGSRSLRGLVQNFRDRRLHDGWATPRTGVRVSFTLFVRQESMAAAGMGYAR